MSTETERHLREVAFWYHEAKSGVRDPVKGLELSLKVCDRLIWLLTYYTEDIQRLEHRERAENVGIVLPWGERYSSAIDRLRSGSDV